MTAARHTRLNAAKDWDPADTDRLPAEKLVAAGTLINCGFCDQDVVFQMLPGNSRVKTAEEGSFWSRLFQCSEFSCRKTYSATELLARHRLQGGKVPKTAGKPGQQGKAKRRPSLPPILPGPGALDAGSNSAAGGGTSRRASVANRRGSVDGTGNSSAGSRVSKTQRPGQPDPESPLDSPNTIRVAVRRPSVQQNSADPRPTPRNSNTVSATPTPSKKPMMASPIALRQASIKEAFNKTPQKKLTPFKPSDRSVERPPMNLENNPFTDKGGQEKRKRNGNGLEGSARKKKKKKGNSSERERRTDEDSEDELYTEPKTPLKTAKKVSNGTSASGKKTQKKIVGDGNGSSSSKEKGPPLAKIDTNETIPDSEEGDDSLSSPTPLRPSDRLKAAAAATTSENGIRKHWGPFWRTELNKAIHLKFPDFDLSTANTTTKLTSSTPLLLKIASDFSLQLAVRHIAASVEHRISGPAAKVFSQPSEEQLAVTDEDLEHAHEDLKLERATPAVRPLVATPQKDKGKGKATERISPSSSSKAPPMSIVIPGTMPEPQKAAVASMTPVAAVAPVAPVATMFPDTTDEEMGEAGEETDASVSAAAAAAQMVMEASADPQSEPVRRSRSRSVRNTPPNAVQVAPPPIVPPASTTVSQAGQGIQPQPAPTTISAAPPPVMSTTVQQLTPAVESVVSGALQVAFAPITTEITTLQSRISSYLSQEIAARQAAEADLVESKKEIEELKRKLNARVNFNVQEVLTFQTENNRLKTQVTTSQVEVVGLRQKVAALERSLVDLQTARKQDEESWKEVAADLRKQVQEKEKECEASLRRVKEKESAVEELKQQIKDKEQEIELEVDEWRGAVERAEKARERAEKNLADARRALG